MASRTFHFPKFSIVEGDIKVNLSLSRFEKQYQEAQFWLDSEVMTSMVPFMPMRDGNFINETKLQSATLAGTGKVVAGVSPMGRYLYEGVAMVDSETGRGPFFIPNVGYRYKRGAILTPTGRPLNYDKSKHPNVTDHWFDAAKQKDGKKWIKGVKKIAGGK